MDANQVFAVLWAKLNSIAKEKGLEQKVVTVLPATGEKSYLYFVPNGSTGDNYYDEYVWDTEREVFERVGSTDVALPVPDGSTLTATDGVWKANYSNPNIIDNSDFSVWQRGNGPFNNTTGQVSNGQSTFGADRWLFTSGSSDPCLTTMEHIGAGCKLSVEKSGSIGYLMQRISNGNRFKGKTLHFSYNVELHDAVMGIPYIHFGGGNGRVDLDSNSNFTIASNQSIDKFVLHIPFTATSNNAYAIIKWIKIEEATFATPYTKPNSAEELNKCRYYYRRALTDISNEINYSKVMRLQNVTANAISGGYEFSAD